MNNAAETTTAMVLTPGQGVTISGWSDANTYTVESVKGRKAVLRANRAKLLNGVGSGEPDALTFTPGGFCGHTDGRQRWEITPDPEGPVTVVTLRKDGQWRRKGEDMRGHCVCDGLHHHYDFNF
jgi:hypothetical protein